jgi:hypothetical protein
MARTRYYLHERESYPVRLVKLEFDDEGFPEGSGWKDGKWEPISNRLELSLLNDLTPYHDITEEEAKAYLKSQEKASKQE